MKTTKRIRTEGVFETAKRFTDTFFDGLKMGAINKALDQGKKNAIIPTPLVQKMIELDKLVKDIKTDTEKYGMDKIDD